jgi:hypothetical protein
VDHRVALLPRRQLDAAAGVPIIGNGNGHGVIIDPK